MRDAAVLADLHAAAAKVEAQAVLVDRHLRHAARWEGPDEPSGAPMSAGWTRLTDAYNSITADPARVLRTEGLAALHRRLACASREEVRPRDHDAALLGELAALTAQSGGHEPPALRAARLQWFAVRRGDLPRSFGWTARLAACAVLLDAGWRSTLVCCLVDERAGGPGPEAPWSAAASVPRGRPSDEDAYLRAALHTMALRTDAVARFRRRDDALRDALTRDGVPPERHDRMLVRFDSLESGDAAGSEPALRSAWRVSAPWPALAPTWVDAGRRLGPQLRRVAAEERAQGRQAPTATARAMAADAIRVRMVSAPPPAASVIVPAYDDAATVAEVLRALEKQDLAEPYEVIVVASGGDATTDIVRRQFPDTVLLHRLERLTPGAARNVGVGAARADVLAFVAADCVPRTDWLRRRVEAHRRGHGVVGGFVDCATPSTWAGWAQYFAKFWSMQPLHATRSLGSGPLFHLSYSRAVVSRAWDDTAVAGEDTAFNDALVQAGHQVWFDADIRVFHRNARRLRVVLREQSEQGEASGRLSAGGTLDRYFGPLLAGPWMPLRLGWRCLVTVARTRPRLLLRCAVSLPLTVAAMAARRRGFRAGRRAAAGAGTVPPAVDGVSGTTRCAVERPRISVVVPAYDEEELIERCVGSLLAQTGPAMEVIVVDDGSRDRTASRAAAMHVRVERTAHRGPAAAKNHGAGVARGDVLVFFDADLVAAPDAVATLCAPVLDGSVAGTYTADISVANPDNGWADCWTLQRGAQRGEHFAAPPPARWDNFRVVRRDLFLDAGGYEDVGYGEDMTLAPKLGVQAVRVDGARLWHHHPGSLREVWDNARWVGRGPVMALRPRPPRVRDLGRSLRRGVAGARQLGRPRYVVFALVYDLGVLTGFRAARRGRRTHAK